MLLVSSRSSPLANSLALSLEIQLAILKVAANSEVWTDDTSPRSCISSKLLLKFCNDSRAWAVS